MLAFGEESGAIDDGRAFGAVEENLREPSCDRLRQVIHEGEAREESLRQFRTHLARYTPLSPG